FEGFCIDHRNGDALFLIPALDMQATIKNAGDVALNARASLKPGKIDIVEQTVVFSMILES
nr:hypothetical protein [Treponema sp.]